MGRKPRITNNEENVHIETSSNRHQKKKYNAYLHPIVMYKYETWSMTH